MDDVTHALGFTEKDVRRLAGARSFERGLGYLSAVSRLEIGEEAITATVDTLTSCSDLAQLHVPRPTSGLSSNS